MNRLFAPSLLLCLLLAACSSSKQDVAPPTPPASQTSTQLPLSEQIAVSPPPAISSQTAAPAEKADQKVDKIRVTGSSVRREAMAPSSPIMDLSAPPMPVTMHSAPVYAPMAAKAQQVENRERYAHPERHGVLKVAEAPVSTFSIDVDSGSYSNVRRMLRQGALPPRDAVRVEELVNYFPYDYPRPAGSQPFRVSSELMPTPWNPNSQLLRIAVQAADPAKSSLPPANLVFLVDVSGSMDAPDKLPLLKSSLKRFVKQLRPQDHISLVTYAGNTRLVLEQAAGDERGRILAAIDDLNAGGSTAGGAGIELAYRVARQGLIEGGINRILLATDGDFNVGITRFESLKSLVEEKRKSGVSLSTLGFGQGNYNDQLMEQLADAGDGAYSYIDSEQEAQKVLVDEFTSTLATVASDVKIQLEFNPAMVAEYRQIGFENRALRREDFNNDKVDAGEIGAGHRVTALYEITLVGQPGRLEALRYGEVKPASKVASNELAWLRLRYKAAHGEASQLLEAPVLASNAQAQAPSSDARFAAAVAAFGQRLADGGKYLGDFDFAAIAKLAQASKGEDRFGYRAEFLQLVQQAQRLAQQDRVAAAQQIAD